MKKRHSVEHIMSKLRQADVELGKGQKVPEVCRQLEISEQILLHDRDTKFPKQFGRILEQAGHKVMRIVPYSPNLTGHAERWIQSIKYECLNHFIVFGERHLQYLLAEYADYYNTQRPHSSCQHLPPSQKRGPLGKEDEAIRVECRGRLGGLLKHYERQAA